MSTKLGELNDLEKQIFKAIDEGRVGDVKQLLNEKSIRIEAVDDHGMTTLMHAAYKGQRDICGILLKRGANVNSNFHEHNYTTLMFAALSGSCETVQIILEAGANTDRTNNVNRTASQMAAFIGQHQVVYLINNWVSIDDLKFYTQPRGLEKEPKLPAHLLNCFHQLMLSNNLSPIRIIFHLQKNPQILEEAKDVTSFLEFLSEKEIKSKATNEVLAQKFHYLSCILKSAHTSNNEKNDNLNSFLKRIVKGRTSDQFQENMELLIRSTFKSFRWADSTLFNQIIRNLSQVKIGDCPTALQILAQGLNGTRMASEEDCQCGTCSEYYAENKCSACKMISYCNQNCQKLHWSIHKHECKELAEKALLIANEKDEKKDELPDAVEKIKLDS